VNSALVTDWALEQAPLPVFWMISWKLDNVLIWARWRKMRVFERFFLRGGRCALLRCCEKLWNSNKDACVELVQLHPCGNLNQAPALHRRLQTFVWQHCLGFGFFLVGALSFHYFKAQHHTPPYQRHQGNNLWKLKCGRVLVNSNWLWVRRWDVVQGSTFNGYNHQSYSWGLHPILWRKIASNSNRFSRKHPNPIRYI